MEDSKKEKEIVTSPEPVSFEGTKNILDQMNNCVCRIFNNGKGKIIKRRRRKNARKKEKRNS